MKTTAVLIPCYNEEKTIGEVVSSFRNVLPDAKIYVYDNNSTDLTEQVAAQIIIVLIQVKKSIFIKK